MACAEHSKMVHKTEFWRTFSAFAAVFAFALGYIISDFASNDKVEGLQTRVVRNEKEIDRSKDLQHEIQQDISEIKILLQKLSVEK